MCIRDSISSTFSDNKKVRDSIKKHFIELGAEPLLYESNLTPSTKPMTYCKDILEADFVILIMKDNYGTETDWGISGTHEEYRIAKENRIPIHVYLKPSKSQDNKLIKELLTRIMTSLQKSLMQRERRKKRLRRLWTMSVRMTSVFSLLVSPLFLWQRVRRSLRVSAKQWKQSESEIAARLIPTT